MKPVFNTINIELTDNYDLYSSKIGGDFISENPPGAFLAQINLSEIPHHPYILPQGYFYFPENGWLQFFIKDDEILGKDWETRTGIVKYIENLNGDIHKSNYEFTPILKESGMKFTCSYEEISIEDYRFKNTDLGKQALKDEELWEQLWDKNSGAGCKLLGYPAFVQYDPREEAKFQKYDTLLFQLDSYPCDRIMWGDSGVGNFFISYENLIKWDFSDIMFTWDCC